MELLLALTISSLFVPPVPGIESVKPFFLFSLLYVFFAVFISPSPLKASVIRPQLWIALAFLGVHVASAAVLSEENLLRELVQVGLLVLLAATVLTREGLSSEKFGKYLLIFLGLIFLYNAIWHISNGYFVQWKRLNEPKKTLTFFPLVTFVVLAIGNRQRPFLALLWLVIGAMIVASGERKALVFWMLGSAILLAQRNIKLAILGAAVISIGVFSATLFMDNEYLVRQISTLMQPDQLFIAYTDSELADLAGMSMSNASRNFAFRVGMEYWLGNPVLGVGTNGYFTQLETNYPSLPYFLIQGIHNEPFRVLVENGLFGLSLYLLALVLSFRDAFRLLRRRATQGVSVRTAAVIYWGVVAALLIPLLTEAGGAAALFLFIAICVLPVPLAQALDRIQLLQSVERGRG
jgi:hypothetical protein